MYRTKHLCLIAKIVYQVVTNQYLWDTAAPENAQSVQAEGTTELMLSLSWHEHFSLCCFSYERVCAECKMIWGFQKLFMWATRSLLCKHVALGTIWSSIWNQGQCCWSIVLSIAVYNHIWLIFFSHPTNLISPQVLWFISSKYMWNLKKISLFCSNPDPRKGYSLIDTVVIF